MPDGLPDRSPEANFERFEIAGRLVGAVASRNLFAGARGRVLAVFDSSFYVAFGAGLVCVGGAGLAAGPLNLIISAPSGTNWRASGLRVDDRVSMVNCVLSVGRRFRFDLAGTMPWAPEPVPGGWTAKDLERGLSGFRQACSGRHFAQGLGGFLHGGDGPGNGSSIHQQARAPVKSLDQWLSAALRDPQGALATSPEDLAGLLGLGPGLTPSGDDYLGGMMIAARSIGEATLCRRLWDVVRPLAASAGNPVALAHLSAASEGLGTVGIHQAIETIIAGRSGAFGGAVKGIDAIGHTSGWDAMAGVTRLFDAWLRARRTGVRYRT